VATASASRSGGGFSIGTVQQYRLYRSAIRDFRGIIQTAITIWTYTALTNF